MIAAETAINPETSRQPRHPRPPRTPGPPPASWEQVKSCRDASSPNRLGWSFLDLDTHLEQRAGATIPEIFATQGEARFRRLESTALASALTHRSTVIALGGGTPESLTNRLLLEQTPATFTIFLDAPFPTLFDRCILQDISRPVLADPETAQARFATRHPLYKRLAGLTIDTATLTSEETVDALLAALANRSRP